MASPSGQQNQAQDDQVLQYVTFRLDDETYGIDVMQIQEVLRYTEIAPVPGAPDYVLGIINDTHCGHGVVQPGDGYPGGFGCRGGVPESQ